MSGIWVDLKAEQRAPELQAGQSILVVDQTLTSTGWNPAPEGQVQTFEQSLAGRSSPLVQHRLAVVLLAQGDADGAQTLLRGSQADPVTR